MKLKNVNVEKSFKCNDYQCVASRKKYESERSRIPRTCAKANNKSQGT